MSDQSKTEDHMDLDYRYNDRDIECPWCGYEHSDSWEWGESGEDACYKCGKPFTWEAESSVTYHSVRLDAPEETSKLPASEPQPNGGKDDVPSQS